MHINSINAYMYKNETHGKSYHIYAHDDDAVDEYNMNIMMMNMIKMNMMIMMICAYPCHDEEVIMMNCFPLRYIHCSK